MAQPQEAFHPSSPPSEGGADSYNHEGTPDTRLTAFSPLEDSSKSSRLLSAISLGDGDGRAQAVKFQGPASFHHVTSPTSFVSGARDKDPFISSPAEKRQTKLSATASTFQPLSTPVVSTPVVAYSSSSVTPKPFGRAAATVSICPKTGLLLAPGLSHNLNLTRSLRVSSSDGVNVDAVKQYLQTLEERGAPFQGCPDPPFAHGLDEVYIRATNIRDASRILSGSNSNPESWKIEFQACGVDVASKHEGQQTLTILLSADLSESQIEANILTYFNDRGVYALEHQPSNIADTLHWVIEFDAVDSTWANETMEKGWVSVGSVFYMMMSPFGLDDRTPPGVNCFAQLQTPIVTSSDHVDVTSGLENMSLVSSQLAMQSMAATMFPSSVPFGGPMHMTSWPMYQWPHAVQSPQTSYPGFISPGSIPAASPSTFQMPTASSHPSPGPGTPRKDVLGRPIQPFYRSEGRRTTAIRINRTQFSPPGPHHNHVDINRIKAGTDVRTTIMLRNIPNKVDQKMLKRIIDESSWGKYDFMYLRIDFANDCNVGYAFINFVDPLDIIDFVNRRANKRWNCFRSDKVAEISYATIQGKDCLVQKFRNSSVMLEAHHYRPKLYYTTNGPVPELAGCEEIFPVPDNQSKMKRSCENAEHVGLFTPNAGQQFRDEQRHRRSQYDRGTRLAALEECDTFDMYPQEAVQ
ncbi:hypothetical protein J7T55_007401 [Diaporthe amygdali]|uniref:uncharacterized protein n=1 Tax=Phomopsis amygdali TaxID=1214568 RepID=UPI0022FEEE45|nr:uncharacterized protein J7T55_007401 [Diaporthe amygdali]KAJ0116421.1 hypothetical protein J7T55_007401 [Diaporthe amygdali]